MKILSHQFSFNFGARLLLLLFPMLQGALLSAQVIEIRLVDGRSGRPMAGAASYVNFWVGTERKVAIATPTDENGLVRLRLTRDRSASNVPALLDGRGSIVVESPIVKYEDSFRINVPYALCVPEGSSYTWLMLGQFSTIQILQHGCVAPKTCGKTTASPKPGQVVLFVRPLTWREKLKQ